MEALKRLAEKYKWLCILTGGIGFFLSPFLWPFFLMIIFQSLSLAAPIIVAAFIIKTVREEKKMNRRVTMEVNRTKAQILRPQKMYQTGEIQRIRKMRRQIYRKGTKKKERSR